MSETQELVGRVAVVTGAGRNIGRAIALALAGAGAAVVINGRQDRAQVDTVVGEIEAHGGRAFGCLADVADSDAVRLMVEAVVTRFGRIDYLINNAALRRAQALDKMTPAPARLWPSPSMASFMARWRAFLSLQGERHGAGAMVEYRRAGRAIRAQGTAPMWSLRRRDWSD